MAKTSSKKKVKTSSSEEAKRRALVRKVLREVLASEKKKKKSIESLGVNDDWLRRVPSDDVYEEDEEEIDPEEKRPKKKSTETRLMDLLETMTAAQSSGVNVNVSTTAADGTQEQRQLIEKLQAALRAVNSNFQFYLSQRPPPVAAAPTPPTPPPTPATATTQVFYGIPPPDPPLPPAPPFPQVPQVPPSPREAEIRMRQGIALIKEGNIVESPAALTTPVDNNINREKNVAAVYEKVGEQIERLYGNDTAEAKQQTANLAWRVYCQALSFVYFALNKAMGGLNLSESTQSNIRSAFLDSAAPLFGEKPSAARNCFPDFATFAVRPVLPSASFVAETVKEYRARMWRSIQDAMKKTKQQAEGKIQGSPYLLTLLTAFFCMSGFPGDATCPLGDQKIETMRVPYLTEFYEKAVQGRGRLIEGIGADAEKQKQLVQSCLEDFKDARIEIVPQKADGWCLSNSIATCLIHQPRPVMLTRLADLLGSSPIKPFLEKESKSCATTIRHIEEFGLREKSIIADAVKCYAFYALSISKTVFKDWNRVEPSDILRPDGWKSEAGEKMLFAMVNADREPNILSFEIWSGETGNVEKETISASGQFRKTVQCGNPLDAPDLQTSVCLLHTPDHFDSIVSKVASTETFISEYMTANKMQGEVDPTVNVEKLQLALHRFASRLDHCVKQLTPERPWLQPWTWVRKSPCDELPAFWVKVKEEAGLVEQANKDLPVVEEPALKQRLAEFKELRRRAGNISYEDWRDQVNIDRKLQALYKSLRECVYRWKWLFGCNYKAIDESMAAAKEMLDRYEKKEPEPTTPLLQPKTTKQLPPPAPPLPPSLIQSVGSSKKKPCGVQRAGSRSHNSEQLHKIIFNAFRPPGGVIPMKGFMQYYTESKEIEAANDVINKMKDMNWTLKNVGTLLSNEATCKGFMQYVLNNITDESALSEIVRHIK